MNLPAPDRPRYRDSRASLAAGNPGRNPVQVAASGDRRDIYYGPDYACTRGLASQGALDYLTVVIRN